ncbi:MAG: AraC family transcriptional regulator [Oscillospiraceae bacterium]|nr:AraC family transcriptional regulator [Oscillospiraceae bacterium]
MREHGSILEGQEIYLTNLLSFRKKLTQDELQSEVARIGQYIEKCGLTKLGPNISVTFAVEQDGVMDIEMLFQLDKTFAPPDGCVCKPLFKLTNAVSIRHAGSPATLQETYSKLMEYLRQRDLQPITSGYNVAVKDAKSIDEIDRMIVDVYIGVSPNVL